jgi:hypothetical protein
MSITIALFNRIFTNYSVMSYAPNAKNASNTVSAVTTKPKLKAMARRQTYWPGSPRHQTIQKPTA